MNYPIRVNACVIRPSYTLMRQCYDDYRTDTAPCKGGVTNQCAVRMSVALVRCGFGLESFPDQRRVHRQRRTCQCDVEHVLGAEELESYLKRALGASIEFGRREMRDPAQVMASVWGQTGILYFNNIFTRSGQSHASGDHIDLFNGERCYNDVLNTTPGGGASSRTASFFERADRVTWFRLV